MTYKEIVKKKEYFQNITWIHLSNCLKAFENRELLSASIWSAVFVESMLKDILSVLLNVNISTEEISSLIARLRNILNNGSSKYELSATAMVYPQNGQEEKYLNGMQNFLEEAQVLFGKFDVEGLAAVKDYFEENGTAYIVMEYLSGPTLQEYEKEHKGKISEKQAEILLEPVINALAYIHSIGIVHCDISPDNLTI